MACINLDRSPDRWVAMRTEFERIGVPAERVTRISAVDGRQLTPADVAPLMTALARLHLKHPELLCNADTLDSLPAVACTLSHVRAWTLLRETPGVPYMVVVEDDARFDPRLAPLMRGEARGREAPLAELFSRPRPAVEWDLVLLGFMPRGRLTPWLYPQRIPEVSLRHKLGLVRPDEFFYGSHAYVVSRSGAERLLRCVFPIELHVDMFFVAARETRRLRSWLVVPGLAFQGGDAPLSIPHLQYGRNYKTLLPDWSIHTVLGLVGITVLVAVLHAMRRRYVER